jgi:hypothetical protein
MGRGEKGAGQERGMKKEEGGRRKEEGGRRKEEGGRRKEAEEGGRGRARAGTI